MEDECHLLWGDTLGYVWGKKNQKTTVKMTNEKMRQTYYGAVNILTGDFLLFPAERGNSEHSINFIKELLSKYLDKKLLIIWDGASYHQSKEVKEFIRTINAGLSSEDWRVTLELFAPNAPEQNPVEDIWLKGKNFLRKNFIENKTFAKVKKAFHSFLQDANFSFSKIENYRNMIL